MRLLVGYDGSNGGRTAIEGLARAGLPDGGEALVLTSADIRRYGCSPCAIRHGINQEVLADAALRCAAQIADRGVALLRRILPGWRVLTAAETGHPGEELVSRAREWEADLIAVGSHGYRGSRPLVTGSVAAHVVRRADGPVRVCRGGAWGEQFGAASEPRIMVAADGSPGGDAAVRCVLERNWPATARVLVFCVVGPPASSGGECFAWEHGGPRGRYGDGRRVAEVAAERLRAAGLDTSAEVAAGSPGPLILRRAFEWSADTLFVGARSRPDGDAPLGHVAGTVAAKASCSVEIARPVPAHGRFAPAAFDPVTESALG